MTQIFADGKSGCGMGAMGSNDADSPNGARGQMALLCNLRIAAKSTDILWGILVEEVRL